MLKNYTYLTEQDLEDGKELAEILSEFGELERLAVKIYSAGLKDGVALMNNKAEEVGVIEKAG